MQGVDHLYMGLFFLDGRSRFDAEELPTAHGVVDGVSDGVAVRPAVRLRHDVASVDQRHGPPSFGQCGAENVVTVLTLPFPLCRGGSGLS